jgi:hypothetical protein
MRPSIRINRYAPLIPQPLHRRQSLRPCVQPRFFFPREKRYACLLLLQRNPARRAFSVRLSAVRTRTSPPPRRRWLPSRSGDRNNSGHETVHFSVAHRQHHSLGVIIGRLLLDEIGDDEIRPRFLAHLLSSPMIDSSQNRGLSPFSPRGLLRKTKSTGSTLRLWPVTAQFSTCVFTSRSAIASASPRKSWHCSVRAISIWTQRK